MKNKKLIGIILIASFVIIGVIWFAKSFAPGSYPYAELYEIPVDEATLIEAINKFKNKNPQYCVPDQVKLKDGRKDKNAYWYRIDFYYPEENQIIFTWTRPANKGTTTFAFVSINDGTVLGNWKDINKDFSRSENRNNKKKFEDRILNPIKTIIERNHIGANL